MFMESKWKKFLGVAALTFVFTLLLGITAFAAPGKVTGLRQTDAYASSAYFSWNAVVGNNIRYQVEWSDNKVTWATVTTNGSSPKNGISGCSQGAVYYVRVAAKEGYDGELGPWSDILEVVTKPEAVNTSSLKQVNASTSSVTIQWGAVPGATQYRIYDYGSGSVGAQRAAVTGTSVTISGLQPDTLYYFAVIPEKSSASFTATASGYYLRTKTVADKVTDIEAQYATKKSVGLRFTRKNNADGYQIQVYDNKGKKKVGKLLDTSSSYVTLNKIQASSFYQVKIRSYINISSGKKYSEWVTYHTANQQEVKLKRSGTSMKLSWKKVTGATNYTIYGKKGKSSGQRKDYKKLGTVKSTKYTATKIGKAKLKKGTTYRFFVVANKKVKGKTYQSVVAYNYWGTL